MLIQDGTIRLDGLSSSVLKCFYKASGHIILLPSLCVELPRELHSERKMIVSVVDKMKVSSEEGVIR